jgi:hypothetical protein
MVRDGVAVDAGLAAAVARYVGGERMNVTAVAVELGVSTESFHKYARRFRAEGVAGFFPRSRRPQRSPAVVAAVVEDAVVLARKQLDADGLDHGATSIRWWLLDQPDRWDSVGPDGGWPVPSRATINRILDRRGLLVKHPARRPRRSYRRFVRPARNDLWQLDGFQTRLAAGRPVWVIELIDDHSRLNLASQAATSENSRDTWLAFTAAVARYGLPRQVLSDNTGAFNGRRRGFTSSLDAAASALGVELVAAAVAHPQTCGKVERHHSTTRRWLARQPSARTITELADQLERYRQIYNNRRHQALNGLTPNQAWTLAPVSGPYGTPIDLPITVKTQPVSASGCIDLDTAQIGLGRRYKHQPATAFRSGDHIAVFIDGTLARELTIDRNRRYQPLA